MGVAIFPHLFFFKNNKSSQVCRKGPSALRTAVHPHTKLQVYVFVLGSHLILLSIPGRFRGA